MEKKRHVDKTIRSRQLGYKIICIHICMYIDNYIPRTYTIHIYIYIYIWVKHTRSLFSPRTNWNEHSSKANRLDIPIGNPDLVGYTRCHSILGHSYKNLEIDKIISYRMLQMMCTFTENTYFEKQLQSSNGYLFRIVTASKNGHLNPIHCSFNQPVKVPIHSCQFPWIPT